MHVFSSGFYSENKFFLPDYPKVTCKPFTTQKAPQILPHPELLSPKDVPPTYKFHYLKEFEAIAGTQALFPIFIQFVQQRCFICCKDSFIIYQLEKHEKFEKVNLPELPTSFKSSEQEILYFGLQSGTIIIYNSKTKEIITNIQQFNFAVIQIQIIDSNSIMGMDKFGNIKYLSLSNKKIMDKIVKISINCVDIVENYRIKKRDKIKNFMKSFSFGKTNEATDSQALQQAEAEQKNNQYHPSKFALLVPNIENQNLYIAYYHRESIKILAIDSSFNICAEQQLLNQAKQIGILQFGQGGFKNSNQKHMILALSVNSTIIFYRGINTQNAIQFIKVAQVGHTKNSLIYSGKFLSNNLLVYLTEQGIEIGNVNQPPTLLHEVNFDHFGYIDFFNTQEEKTSINKTLIYRNMLKNIVIKHTHQSEAINYQNGNCEYVCLEGKRISFGMVYSWKNYLDQVTNSCVQSIGEEGFEWQVCMKLGMMVYFEHITMLAGVHEIIEVRMEQMRNFFEKIAITYLSFSLKQQQIDQRAVIRNVTDFMVRTESFSYLFTTIFGIITNNNLTSIFFSAIKPYIAAGAIKAITLDVLQLIIQQYLGKNLETEEKENNIQDLQILFMNFDFQRMERVQILSFCLNYGLFRSLISICKDQNDFVTPLIKLCGMRLEKARKQETSVDIDKLSDIIFWYLTECLEGHMTKFNDDQAYIGMLDQLITFLFIPSSLQMLLQSSVAYLLQTVNMIFSTKIMQYIMENDKKFKIKKNQYLQNRIFIQDCLSQFKLYEQILCTLIYTIKTSKQPSWNASLLRFVTFLILKNTFPFSLKYKRQAFIFAIKNPFAFLESQNFDTHNFIALRILDSIILDLSHEINQKEKQKFLYSLVDNLEVQKLTFQQDQQSCRSQFTRDLLFKLQSIYAKGLILHEMGKNNQVIEHFIKSKCTIFTTPIFSYIGINLFGPQTKWSCLQYFINQFQALLEQNPVESFNLALSISNRIPFEKLGYEYYEIIINKLQQAQLHKVKQQLTSDSEHLTLNFIEKTLTQEQVLELGLLKQKLLNKHLQIVVRDRVNDLEYYILNIDYPLEQAYRVCQEINNKAAMAYILIKSGRNRQGVYMLTDIFLSKAKEAFREMAKNSSSNLLPKMKEQLIRILQTCNVEYLNDPASGEQIWEQVVDKLFKDLNAKNVEKIGIEPIKQILKEYIDIIITKMFSQVTADFFINKYAQKIKVMPTWVFLKAYTLVYHRLQFSHVINSLTKELLRLNQMKKFIAVITETRKAVSISSEQQCLICGIFLEQLPVVWCYLCGHKFHSNCIVQMSGCPKCKQAKIQQVVESTWVTMGENRAKQKLECQKYAKVKSRDQGIQKQRRNKLYQYDCIIEQQYKEII